MRKCIVVGLHYLSPSCQCIPVCSLSILLSLFLCRRQSHFGSSYQRSHSRPLTSKSTSHLHSSKRRRSKSRSHFSCKQRSKFHSPRMSKSQSSSRKRSRSHSPRHSSSSRSWFRSQSPMSHRWDRYSVNCRTGILWSNSLYLLTHLTANLVFTELEPDFQILPLYCCCSMFYSLLYSLLVLQVNARTPLQFTVVGLLLTEVVLRI